MSPDRDYSGELIPPQGSCKKVFLSFLLLILGLGLAIGGFDVVVNKDKSHGFALIFLGIIVLIPGMYYSYKVYKGCRGKGRFSFDSIPDV
ncbi:hypothetical protein BSKO_11904 [Bryopsis sp. KO-2023]|nr:hypothetical protein BSKO_11904 [Bryopsis sp. KO-2023]